MTAIATDICAGVRTGVLGKAQCFVAQGGERALRNLIVLDTWHCEIIDYLSPRALGRTCAVQQIITVRAYNARDAVWAAFAVAYATLAGHRGVVGVLEVPAVGNAEGRGIEER